MHITKQLNGKNILVTRPAQQATFLANEIRALGGNPILFPVLEITDIEDTSELLQLIQCLDEFDWAIFVSPNAVNKAMHFILQSRELPSNLKYAAVGKGTAVTLKKFGINKILIPANRFDSEALLELHEMQDMSGNQVIIFRGVGGRPLLGDTLIQRGANLKYAECYQRKKPEVDIEPLLSLWTKGELHAVIITSSEGLHNLFDIIGKLGQQLLKITPIFTAHERIAQTAKDLGLEKIVKTFSSGDDGLLESLKMYFGAHKKKYQTDTEV